MRVAVGATAAACLCPASPAHAVGGPTNTSRPAILGVAQAGHTLQAKRGSWSSVTSPTYSYRWCWTSGSTCQKTLANGASKTSYVPSAADIGKRILLLVTATDEVGSTTAASDPTAPVAPDPPDNDSKPTFSGTAREGSTLTKTSNGAWSHPKPTSYSSQWLRCDSAGAACSAIPGATDDSYKLDAADVGRRIRLRVRAGNPLGNGVADSNPSDVVVSRAAPPPRSHRRARRLSPFPRILVLGSLSPGGATFREVLVKGPRNVTVRTRCVGRGCPYSRHSYRMRHRRLRIRALERSFAAGTLIELRVVKRGRVGKYTRIRIRRGRIPARVDRCLDPGTSRPRRCGR